MLPKWPKSPWIHLKLFLPVFLSKSRDFNSTLTPNPPNTSDPQGFGADTWIKCVCVWQLRTLMRSMQNPVAFTKSTGINSHYSTAHLSVFSPLKVPSVKLWSNYLPSLFILRTLSSRDIFQMYNTYMPGWYLDKFDSPTLAWQVRPIPFFPHQFPLSR